jgi:hypothetical protein
VPDDVLNDQYDARPSARHFALCSVTFMDGHSKSMPLNRFYGVSNGVGVFFTANQKPVDLWFCADPLDALEGNGLTSNCSSN